MNKTWNSPCGGILKPLSFSLTRQMKWFDSGTGEETVLVFCLRVVFFCSFFGWCVKIGVKSRDQKQVNVKKVFKNGEAMPARVQCVNRRLWWRRETARWGSCQSCCAGVGKALRGLNTGLNHSVTLSCCTWSCSRSYPLNSHHLSLRIQPQETERRGGNRQKTEALLHRGSLCSNVPDKRLKLLKLQFIFS